MNLLAKAKLSLNNLKEIFAMERDIASRKRIIKMAGLGFITRHIATTNDGGYPIFLADEFVYISTHTKGIPQAIALVSANGAKEIYVNNLFLELSGELQDAVLQHEVGHLTLNAVYNGFDRFLYNMRLSNKVYLCECAADDYAVASGYKMRDVLVLLRDKYGFSSRELNARIARLTA